MLDHEQIAYLFDVTDSGNLTTLKLLRAGWDFDINIQDPSGNTLLLVAVRRNDKKTALYLLDNGADHTIPNRIGETPLVWASFNKNEELTTLFLDNQRAAPKPHV